MCGRAYATFTDDELALRYLNKRPPKFPSLKPNYNLSPTQEAPIVRVVDGERQLELFRWQLVPPWEPEFKTKLSTINARSEGVFESRLYKGLIVRRRCIVPVSGFFEWKRDGEKKRPFSIHLKNQPIMSLAGLWDAWKPPVASNLGRSREDDAPTRHSFTILTTAANEFMTGIHDRMPVVLAREDEDAWLDPSNQDPARIAALLKPCPAEWLDAYEVSTMVNSPRNNSPEILEPVKA